MSDSLRERYIELSRELAAIDAAMRFDSHYGFSTAEDDDDVSAEQGDDGWMGARQAADYMDVSERTVQKWASEGRLKGRKSGRHWKFKKSACDKAMKGG